MMVKKRKLHGKIIATETTKAADKVKAKEEATALNAAAEKEEVAGATDDKLTGTKTDSEDNTEEAAEEAVAPKKKAFFLSKHERTRLKKRRPIMRPRMRAMRRSRTTKTTSAT
ncbi:uncharacterized protein PITG_08293 [Phytophthora infestans T30-4]|uniref:Uncharacterized protein n=1 Tax=Phytophthora infestans (strain T30-4) TaxID=403677 RepID=D0NA88_PHYIT|nr:uncharacterized protein PITG_08293 [Phytophthora infestans T30-4]EEY54746.1 conserved hypothetical protein [Phytophthora infestans T30-4]|eukprot:XP_002903691.1 conserved hypothetical protein [Phytophthora infestans T30-4]